MNAGLRHVTRLAASYVAGVSRPISCCKEDVATVAAKAAVASHGKKFERHYSLRPVTGHVPNHPHREPYSFATKSPYPITQCTELK
eukprot:1158562-Pelagomonas_calceolata.AAC.16